MAMMVEGVDALVAGSAVLATEIDVGVAQRAEGQALHILILQLHVLEPHMRIGRVFPSDLDSRKNQNAHADREAAGNGKLTSLSSDKRDGKDAKAQDV